MYNLTNLDKLIIYVDEEIKKYASKFATEKIAFDSLTTSLSFITNERTISSFINSVLEKKFITDGCAVLLSADEFEVHPNPAFKRNVVKRQVQGSKKAEKAWKECFVDGYFKVSNLISSSATTHLLIEFKLKNSFVYLALARDYLKYKILTCQNYANTIFAYVVAQDKPLYPTILCKNPPYYQILNINLRKKTIQKDKRVFVFVPKAPTSGGTVGSSINPQNNPNNPNNNPSSPNSNPQTGTGDNGSADIPNELLADVTKVYDLLTEVNDISQKVLKEKEKVRNLFNDNEILYITGMNRFNCNVAISKFLRDHYLFLKKVWEKCEEIGFFSEQKQVFQNNVEAIIEESGKYRKNVSEYVTANDKIRANRRGLLVNIRVSLFIVATIDYLNEEFQLGVTPPQYSSRNARVRRENVEVNDKDAVDLFKKRLANMYRNKSGQGKIKRLSYCLLYYLINLFSIIYEFDKNSGEIVDFKKTFKKYKMIGKLQSVIEEIEKSTLFKGERINVESLIMNETENSADALLDLASHIISNY